MIVIPSQVSHRKISLHCYPITWLTFGMHIVTPSIHYLVKKKQRWSAGGREYLAVLWRGEQSSIVLASACYGMCAERFRNGIDFKPSTVLSEIVRSLVFGALKILPNYQIPQDVITSRNDVLITNSGLLYVIHHAFASMLRT